jgi:hypothetical protein
MTNSPTRVLKINFFCLVWVAIWSLFLCSVFVPTITNAQTTEKVRSITTEFVPEDGCPVSVVDAKAILDVDSFDAPFDARIYISYKNISDRPISAAKFRVRFCDATGAEVNTFQASDSSNLGPGQDCTQKWKKEPLNPRVASVKMRVLLIKYSDGSVWQSAKMQELTPPPS